GPARLADDVGRDPVGVALAGAVADRCAVPSEARSVTTAVTATPSVARQATPTATRVVAPCHQATASSPPVTTCSHPGHRDRVDGRTTAEQTCRLRDSPGAVVAAAAPDRETARVVDCRPEASMQDLRL